jgi:hypothetical protein
MKKRFFPCFAVLILVVVSASAQPGFAKKGWPSNERYAFITECVNAASAGMSVDSARFYCYCMQEKIEDKFPIVQDAAKLTAEDMQTDEWKKNINACLGGTWSDKDRIAYLADCKTKASKLMTAEKAGNYCECMLFKLEKKYPNAADAMGLPASYFESDEWKRMVKSCVDF